MPNMTISFRVVVNAHSPQRLDFANGPTVKILVGNTVIAEDVPKKALMGISSWFNNLFTVQHPQATSFMFNPNEIDEKCVRQPVDFIKFNLKVNKPFGIKPAGYLVDSIVLYRHVLGFGMALHAPGLIKSIRNDVNDPHLLPSYAELDAIVELPAGDKIYLAAVHRMERMQHIGDIANDDKNEWKEWLELHPQFKADVEAWQVTLKARLEEQRAVQRAAQWEKDFPTLC
ncbi:hypothetical protein BU23DRAFT_643876 [Bimuria novae-zelandiae CBS 107.79]|uniref:BTB domain-containing protein n=1 Tax=Bimuria novae-zelandiae CBS 107.79 TaxID=1447943 RepID=A0A6A5V5N9_9PLEO|nr:hypothetical protein BU23DRAFT_643876 [Bimuria novae-zelandiae CBS 107.79]